MLYKTFLQVIEDFSIVINYAKAHSSRTIRVKVDDFLMDGCRRPEFRLISS